jgi:hypothetical protein
VAFAWVVPLYQFEKIYGMSGKSAEDLCLMNRRSFFFRKKPTMPLF